jgi:hypothetical protein
MKPTDFCNKWGHNTYPVLDNEEVTIERCKECKSKLEYRKADGRIDNKKYVKDHYRDFIQYGTKDYARFYNEADRRQKEAQDAKETKEMIDENNEEIERIKAKRRRETFSTGKVWF